MYIDKDMAESYESLKTQFDICLRTIDRLHEQLEKSRLKRIDLKIEIGQLLDVIKQYNHLDEVPDSDD